MKKSNEKGITLIALIITIIVLLILAGISIATLTGQNGVLTKAINAGEETKREDYEEAIKIIGNGLRSDKIFNSWDKKTYLDEFEKEIKKDSRFKEAQMKRKNDGTIFIITKENYIFKVTENDVECLDQEMLDQEMLENKVNDCKNPDGSMNYEKLKEELEKIEGIQGVPDTIDSTTFPLVVKVKDEFIEILEDGTLRYC